MTEPGQFLIHQSEDGSTRIDVMLEAETQVIAKHAYQTK